MEIFVMSDQYFICSTKFKRNTSVKYLKSSMAETLFFSKSQKKVFITSDTTIKCYASASILVDDFKMMPGWFKMHQDHYSSGNTLELWSSKL